MLDSSTVSIRRTVQENLMIWAYAKKHNMTIEEVEKLL